MTTESPFAPVKCLERSTATVSSVLEWISCELPEVRHNTNSNGGTVNCCFIFHYCVCICIWRTLAHWNARLQCHMQRRRLHAISCILASRESINQIFQAKNCVHGIIGLEFAFNFNGMPQYTSVGAHLEIPRIISNCSSTCIRNLLWTAKQRIVGVRAKGGDDIRRIALECVVRFLLWKRCKHVLSLNGIRRWERSGRYSMGIN